jgi:RNA polymerase sigma-70 factor (ECF subfamily)
MAEAPGTGAAPPEGAGRPPAPAAAGVRPEAATAPANGTRAPGPAPRDPSETEADRAQRAESRSQDLGLIDRALAGDNAAFEALFEKYREKVYRVVYGYVHDKDDALDVTQEAFIKAFKNLPGFERESGFYTWLTRIAINLAIDFRRRRARKKVVALEDYMDPEGKVGGSTGEPHPTRRLEERELRERYFQALEQLSEKHRTVFLLHTVEDMAYKDIASALDISIGTVMSRLHYARKRLQELLADYLK